MKKGIILSLVLSLCFGLFALAGCGNVNIETLSGSYQKLLDAYSQYSTSIVQNKEEDKVVSVSINFSEKIDAFISDERENGGKNFVELEDTYNQILTISTQYTAEAMDFVAGLKDNFSKEAQQALNNLNKSLANLTNYIPNFIHDKNIFEEYFEYFETSNDSSYDQKVKENQLQTFKKSFGELVSKTISVSSNFANVVENTKLFDVVKESSLNKTDTILIKEYIRAKLLPVFVRFTLDQVQNQFIWDYDYVSEDKDRFEKLFTDISDKFEEYKTQFVNRSNDEVKVLSNSKENPEMSNLLNLTETFFTDAEDFYISASNMSVYDFVYKYDYNWEDFAEKNIYAESYMHEMETFINYTLPLYMNSVVEIIYGA